MINDLAEPFAHSFREASRYHRLGNEVEACRHITLALAEEKGLPKRLPVLTSYEDLYARIPALSAEIETPKRAASLSGFLTLLGRGDLAAMLLVRAAQLTPPVARREPLHVDDLLRQAQAFADGGDHAAAAERVSLVLTLENPPVDPLLAGIGPMLASTNASTVLAMANLLLGCGLRAEAALLFSRYGSLAPETADLAEIDDRIDGLDAERYLDRAISHQQAGRIDQADRLIRRALSHDPGPERLQPDRLGPDLLDGSAVSMVLATVRHATTVSGLRALCELRGLADSVALCDGWLASHAPEPR